MDAIPDWVYPHGLPLALTYLAAIPIMKILAGGTAALGCFVLAAWMQVQRWRVLLDAQGLAYREAALWRSWLSACAFGLFFPGPWGRDLWRFGDLARDAGAPRRVFAAVVIEKAAAFIAFAAIALVAALPGFAVLGISISKMAFGAVAMLLLGLMTALLGVLLQPRVLHISLAVMPLPATLYRRLMPLTNALTICASKPRSLVKAIGLSLLADLFAAGAWAVLFLVIRESGSVFQALVAGPLHLVLPLINPVARNTTVFEDLAGILFANTPRPVTIALTGILAWFFLRAVLAVPGVIVLAWRAVCGFRLGGTTATARGPSLEWDEEAVAAYRAKIITTLLAGLGGGILGGAIAGLAEASWFYWLWRDTTGELRMFWWGPLAYGLAFSLIGLAVSAALVFVYLLWGKFRHGGGTLAFSAAVTLAASFVLIGRFRYVRDVLGERLLTAGEIMAIVTLAILLFIVTERAGSWILRRSFRSRVSAAAALLAAWALIVAAGAMAGPVLHRDIPRPSMPADMRASGPNIILVVADTLRADYLPVYNEKALPKTPALSAFARDAVVFKNSYSQAPWTRPSFATMFTGRYPGQHGTVSKVSVMRPAEMTLAEILLAAGYYTQGFPNNRNLLPMYGLDQGFAGYDFLTPHLYFGASFSVERFSLYEVLRRIRVALNAPAIDVEHFYQPAPVVSATAAHWLDAKAVPADAPFFLYTHYMDPHDPYMDADRPGIGYSSILIGTKPDPDVFRKPITYAYIDEIERVDDAFGSFLADLKRRGLYDDALIVFTADHGEEIYDHQGWSHGPTLYDELTHVPIIIKFPEGRHAGTVNSGIARHIDLAPTILQLAGLPVPGVMSGIALEDGAGQFQNAGTRESFAETDFTKVVATSIRTRDHKLIRANPGNPRGLETLEVYDIQGDPGETRNLSGRGMVYESALSAALDAHAAALSGGE